VEPYEFHEIKHKKSTPRHGSHWYQWEDYRFASARAMLDARILPWNAEFYHTIHDHRRVGVDSEVNDIRDWLTLPVSKMVTMFDAGECEIEDGRTTIRNSVSDVPTKLIWWPKSAWVPLATLPQYGNL